MKTIQTYLLIAFAAAGALALGACGKAKNDAPVALGGAPGYPNYNPQYPGCVPSAYNNYCNPVAPVPPNPGFQQMTGTSIYAQAGQKIQVTGKFVWGTDFLGGCNNHKDDFPRTCIANSYGTEKFCDAAPGSIFTVTTTGYFTIYVNLSGINNVCRTNTTSPTLTIVP